MDRAYDTLIEAIESLKKDGYIEDFNLCDAGVENKQRKTIHNSDELNVVRVFRFEGSTNPDDSSVLYAIETTSGEKGVLLDAYGAYAGNISPELLKKLRMH